MRLGTLRDNYGDDELCHVHDRHLIPVRHVNAVFGTFFLNQLDGLLTEGQLDDLLAWHAREGEERLSRVPEASVHWNRSTHGKLLPHPRKIWGIGLNYPDHAGDLNEATPSREPASFMKPDTTLIAPGEAIQLPDPAMTQRVTGEAELAIVIGRECRNVPEADWLSVVAGFTSALDMTAEDILRRNPRNLTQAKSFDTFLSLGPELVTPDEFPDLGRTTVATVLNGEVIRENTLSAMTFSPAFLVSYHSRIMTLLPGDVILTGTPGAVVLAPGDVLECRISGLQPLLNPVAGPPLRE